MAADGRILIDTKINTTGIVNGTDEVIRAARRMATQVNGLSNSVKASFARQADSIQKAARVYEEQKEKVIALREKLEELKNQQIPTDKYKNLESEIKKNETALDKLIEKQIRFVETGGKTNSTTFERMEYDIEQARQKLDELRIAKQHMESQGTAFTIGGDTATIESTTAKLAHEESRLLEMNRSLITSYDALKNKVEEYGGKLSSSSGCVSAFRAAVNGLKIVLKSPVFISKGIFSGLISGLKNLSKVAQKAALALAQLVGRGVVGGLKKITAGVFGLDKATRKSNSGFGMSLKSILKYGLGIRSLYALVNKLRTALTEGFKNLAQYSNTTNSTLSGLMSSLEQCKNALATAFDPILQAVAPALNYLINLVTTAATAIAQLIAALTGKSTFVKAVKVQKDYAKSLKGTGGAAKKAGEEAEGSLASFDKLNVMAEENSGGSGGGGGGGGGVSAGDMFETVSVEPINFDSWGEAFNSFLGYLLNKGIPALKNTLSQLADGINSFATNLYEMFTFPGVKDKVQLLGRDLAEALNDFTSQIDWAMIGKALGSGFNLAIQFLVSFIWSYDWMALGGSLATMLNNIVEQVNWYDFGKLLWAKFKIALETLAGFLMNLDMKGIAKAASDTVIGFVDSISETLMKIDWQGIGNQIATFIGSIDYAGVFDSLCYGIGVACASLAEFLWGLIEEAWKAMVNWWEETAYEDGEFTMEGLLRGIDDVLKSIGTWIKEHIFEPLIDGVCDAFGIHSPSTVMAEMGRYLMQGLLNGLTEFLQPVIDKFTELKEKIGKKWKEIKESTSAKWSDIKTSLFDIWDELKNKAKDKFGEIKNAVTGAWDKIKNFGKSVGGIVTERYSDTASVMSLRTMAPSAESIHLPRLASGTVVPPRAGEFAAILGDNRRETEVVSPLSTIKQALKEGMLEFGGTAGGDINLTVNLDGRVVYQNVIKRNRQEIDRTGSNPLMIGG